MGPLLYMLLYEAAKMFAYVMLFNLAFDAICGRRCERTMMFDDEDAVRRAAAEGWLSECQDVLDAEADRLWEVRG